ncbi:MAG: tubulin-like doman-containing protein [Pseudoclavibacter sp.]
MYKALVVGCGGSGGSALAYMMDQLKGELKPYGIDEIPSGWQFVHIDVPTAPDTKIPGVGNVREQGGSYISTAPTTGKYQVLDNSISQWIGQADAFGEFGTWAPRDPAQITVPITVGAGQMRAVGRVITLARARDVFDGLNAAVRNLNTVETNTAMAELQRAVPATGGFSPENPPLVIVVSSMAGGAGASMALDVCRILSLVPGVDPGLTGVFMVAPDAFDQLPESARGGVRANALAMLGEIVATQTNAAEEHDIRLLRALGLEVQETGRPPFARVFPVGRYVGVEKTLFGDGSQSAVYRGLGRGLSAMIMSGSASGDFVSFDLGNNSDPAPANPDYLGWGASNPIPWGSFGFASLSLGRDRYRHYAAQRLARFSVDRLRTGHLQPGVTTSSVDQLRALADSQWSRVAASIGLPVAAGYGALAPEQAAGWFTSQALGRQDADQTARQIIDSNFAPFVPHPAGQAGQWVPILQRFMVDRAPALQSGASEGAYRWAFAWSQQVHDAILRQVQEATELFGLAYAREILDRIERLIRDDLTPRLGDLAGYQAGDLAQVPPQFMAELGAMKGGIANPQGLVERLCDLERVQLTDTVYARAADLARGVLLSLVSEVIAPLKSTLSNSIGVLDNAVEAPRVASGLANVQTDQYGIWPSENDQIVPERFDVAENEILLTPSAGFDRQYESDLRRAISVGENMATLEDARVTGSRAVISGYWPVAEGQQAPGGLLTVHANWRPAMFNRDPMTGQPLTPSHGKYELHVAPGDLVDRALQFVRRQGEAFEQFCSLSLRDYAKGVDIPSAELPRRLNDLVGKFNETLSRALPLISLDADAVNTIHNRSPEYRFKFSAVPFQHMNELMNELQRVVRTRPNVAEEVAAAFDNALAEADKLTRIDVFGSYRNYSPLVFDALLKPVSQQWTGTAPQGRLAFWAQRRSRPLEASLPESDIERRTMITGWYMAQITGQLRFPEPPYDSAVEVWDDESRRWLEFPHPLLTPPSEFRGQSVDWLPAVLESHLIAIARAHDVPVMSSLRPYRRLRRLADANLQHPERGLVEARGAVIELARWIETGDSPSGVASRIEGETLEERSENAKAWIEQIRTFTASNFIAPARRSETSGPYGAILNREHAANIPLFRDLAPDIVEVTTQLLDFIDVATQRAKRGTSAAPINPSSLANSVGQGSFGGSGTVPAVPDAGFGGAF